MAAFDDIMNAFEELKDEDGVEQEKDNMEEMSVLRAKNLNADKVTKGITVEVDVPAVYETMLTSEEATKPAKKTAKELKEWNKNPRSSFTTREELLELVKEHGANKAGYEKIAARLGVNISTIYTYVTKWGIHIELGAKPRLKNKSNAQEVEHSENTEEVKEVEQDHIPEPGEMIEQDQTTSFEKLVKSFQELKKALGNSILVADKSEKKMDEVDDLIFSKDIFDISRDQKTNVEADENEQNVIKKDVVVELNITVKPIVKFDGELPAWLKEVVKNG